MVEGKLAVLAVAGSLKDQSVSRVVLKHLAEKMTSAGCTVDFLDLAAEPLELFNPDHSRKTAQFAAVQPRVDRADVYLLGSPDYHGSMSGALSPFALTKSE